MKPLEKYFVISTVHDTHITVGLEGVVNEDKSENSKKVMGAGANSLPGAAPFSGAGKIADMIWI